ncbi:MAG: DUF4880 domain-containing protein, partial [Terriglobales bacterium]
MKPKDPRPLNRQILDEASAWFVDFRVGDADAAARERFDQWLRQSPEHIRAYTEIARTYVELPALMAADNPIDIERLVMAARASGNVVSLDMAPPVRSHPVPVLPGSSAPRWSQVQRPRWGRFGLAAVLIFVVAVSGWLWVNRYPTYVTEIGENRSITLADGSTINLNARSKIRIEFSRAERNVELLEGQVLFE